MSHLGRSALERFEEKYTKATNCDCWHWVGTREPHHGYGRFWYGGRIQNASRVSWILYRGDIASSDIQVCHSCDNPKCVNPNHLWLGTAKDNALDSHRKNRQPQGREKHSAKLNEAKARAIFVNTELTQPELAELYGVSTVIIHRVCTRRTWKHATRDLVAPQRASVAGFRREQKKRDAREHANPAS